MTPKPTSMVLSLGLAAWVGGCGTSSHIAKEADRGYAHPQLESMLELKPDHPVHTIVLPHDEPVFRRILAVKSLSPRAWCATRPDTSRCSRRFPARRGKARSPR